MGKKGLHGDYIFLWQNATDYRFIVWVGVFLRYFLFFCNKTYMGRNGLHGDLFFGVKIKIA